MSVKETTPIWKRPLHLGWAAVIMGLSVLISRFMGLFRDKVISFLFGATAESDIYFAAFVIPDYINYLLAGAYFSITLIPLLALYFEKDERDGWRFFSAVFIWIGLAITLLTAAAMAFAPQLAHIAAPGLDPQASKRLALFLRIVMPAQIWFLLGSALMAILYLRKQFLAPALAPIVYNLSIITGGILLRKRGMEGFCWGVHAGAFLGFFLIQILAVGLSGERRFRLYPCLTHPGLKKFVFLALPLMLGQSIVVLDEQLIRIFGSLAGTGAISWLNYARRIMLVPVGVVAQAAGVASYPFLSELFAKKDFGRFHETIHTALLRVMTILIPLSTWMMLVSGPTIRLIFQQGRFGTFDTDQTALLLRILLSAVFFWGFQQILGRAFYARQDTLTPAVLGTITTILSLPIYYFMAKSLNVAGIAMASVASISGYSIFLASWWKYRFGGDVFTGLAGDMFKLIMLSIVASIPAGILVWLEPARTTHPYVGALWAMVSSGIAFSVVFMLLSSRTAPALVRPFLRKVGPIERLLFGCEPKC